MEQINFSIIIPHKNIPVLLERLLKSIPEREDLEIILVDDHSDAEVVKCLNQLVKKNLRLVYNHGAPGAGNARNYVIPMAKGKWVLFADSDDFFNAGFANFLNEYVDSDADIVYFSANSLDLVTQKVSNRADHIHEYMRQYKNDKRIGETILRYKFSETVCKMVKRDMIEKYSLRFDHTKIHEDVKFAISAGHHARKIAVVDEELYCITSREGSLSRTQTNDAYMDELKVFAWWKKLILDNRVALDFPKFDYRLYQFARHLYKDNKLFRSEYRILRDAGFSRSYITGQIIKYMWKSLGYKIGW